MLRPRSPILVLVLFLVLAGAAAADIITVTPDGPLTIQLAIMQAVDGDIVELTDGVYTGAGNRDLRLHGKAITIRSQSGDPTTCVLDPQGESGALHRGFLFQDAEGLDTVIEGLTVTGGHHYQGGGMYCALGYPTVRNCRFVGNQGGDGGGFATTGPSRAVDCWFADNVGGGGGGAAAINTVGEIAVFERCTFVRNQATSWGGGFRS